jgi:hypothetical protein
LVCGGVLLIPQKEKEAGRFHMPFINGKYIFPLLVLVALLGLAIFSKGYFSNLLNFDFSSDKDFLSGKISFMDVATPKISLIIFWLVAIVLAIITFRKNYSLIPVMGLITCMYLLTGMTKSNWAWFFAWMIIGVVFYGMYGYRKSKLALCSK